MGLEFKHYAFITVLICSMWALTVAGFTSVEGLGNIKLNSELPDQEVTTNFGEAPIDKFAAIIKVLNVAIPIALLGVVLLVITYNANPIGLSGLVLSIALFVFAYSRTIEATDQIRAKSKFSIDARVWWM